MMDIKQSGASIGINVTSMLVKNAVAKNREMKDLIDRPTHEVVKGQTESEKQGSKVKEVSSQASDSGTTTYNDQPVKRVVDVKV